MRILSRLPRHWLTDVVVIRGGGKDARGNPLPTTEIPRKNVAVVPRATSDPVDRSDVVAGTAVLYDEDTSFRYQSTDRVKVPTEARMAGDWSVDGRPGEWPLGTEVGLVRA